MDIKTISYSLGDTFPESVSDILTDSVIVACSGGLAFSDITATVVPSNPTQISGSTLAISGSLNGAGVGATLYVGKSIKFDTVSFYYPVILGGFTRTISWQYWNGSTWATISTAANVDRALTVTNGEIKFYQQTNNTFKLNSAIIYKDWATTTINGGASYYYIRGVVSTTGLSDYPANLTTYDSTTQGDNSRIDVVLTTADDSTFTDVTKEAASDVSNALTFTTTGAPSAAIYCGFTDSNVSSIRVGLSTAGTAAGTGAITSEYWNGSTWSSLSTLIMPSLTSPNSYNFGGTGSEFRIFITPTDWATKLVSGNTKYWIRLRATTAYNTVQPAIRLIDCTRTKTFNKTIYIPETSNRIFKSVYAKFDIYNPTVAGLSNITARGRFGSDAFRELEIGDGYRPNFSWEQFGGKVWTFNGVATYGDRTTAASDSAVSSAVGKVPQTNAVDAALYFGYPNEAKWANHKPRLDFINASAVNLSTGGVVAWEFYNGSTWEAFTPIVIGADVNLNSSLNATSAAITVICPKLPNWTATNVNGSTLLYIRKRTTTIFTTIADYGWIITSAPGTFTEIITNSGENNSYSFTVDATDLFTSSMTSATSGAFSLELGLTPNPTSVYIGDVPLSNGELFITYTADEQDTRIKTVCIPISGSASNLTSVLTSIGSNQIPALDTYLPEASKVIRNFYIVASGNDSTLYSYGNEFAMRLDSDTVKYSQSYVSIGVSGNIINLIYEKDNINTSTTHDIQMAITGRQPIKNLALMAVVTYEYSSASSTRIINSLILPFLSEESFSTSNQIYPEKIRKTISIQEPGTINNEDIGVYFSLTEAATPSLFWRDKSESLYSNLIWSAPSVATGGFRASRKLPTQNLSRGTNEIGVDFYPENLDSRTRLNAYLGGYFIVNYHSDKASSGVQTHNKTLQPLLMTQGLAFTANTNWNFLTWLTGNRYTNNFGFQGAGHLTSVTSAAPVTYDVGLSLIGNNATKNINTRLSGGVTEGESIYFDIYGTDENNFKKYPQQIDGYNVSDGGVWSLNHGVNTIYTYLGAVICCHEITYSFTGQLLGYSGDGSGLVVSFYDSNTHNRLFTATTIAGGTFGGVWYDNTSNIVCEVYDPGLSKFASSPPQLVDSGTFIIDFDTGGTSSSAVWG